MKRTTDLLSLKPDRIRPIAICAIRNDDRILVAEGHDPLTGQLFYRPLGGSIEYGERSMDTIRRELMEEAGLDVINLRYLETMENIFTYNGQVGHEIVLVYEGDLVDQAVYDSTELTCREDDGSPFKAVWKPLDSFGSDAPLYPDGLMELLKDYENDKERE